MRTHDPADPIDALYGEHDEALAHLDLLGRAARALGEGTGTPLALGDLDRAIRFLGSEIRAHNEWEETQLFPRLERATGPGGPCAVMREEHRRLWDLYETVAPARRAAAEEGANAASRERLARVATAIVDLLTAHIAKENEILFPMARRILTTRDLEEMAAARP